MEISDVPKKTKEYFLELSKEYNNQLGLTLKSLCDLHKGCFPVGNEEVEMKLEALAEKILDIERKIVDSEPKKPEGRKMLDGTIIGGIK